MNNKISSKDLAKEYKFCHLTILNVINKNMFILETFGNIKKIKAKPGKGSKGGKPSEFFLLNDKQRDFLLLLLHNDHTKKYKYKIIERLYKNE